MSFSYECHSRRDVPVNPKIYRVRGDLSWEDVIYNSAREKSYLNGTLWITFNLLLFAHIPSFFSHTCSFINFV